MSTTILINVYLCVFGFLKMESLILLYFLFENHDFYLFGVERGVNKTQKE